MTTESESSLENQLVAHLGNLGYSSIKIKDETELENNFRTQINTFNAASLKGIPLSDSEFSRLLSAIKDKGVIASAQALRDKTEIQRDDNTNLFIQLFDSRNKTRNIYQVTRQVTVLASRENRYDVTLLINGLPIVQIELKRRGLEISEAFNQINRYRRETFVGLYEFLQLFVISNGENTKYFANSPSTAAIPFSHTFFWTDDKNKRISSLIDFVDSFLPTYRLADIISRFMIIKGVTASDKNLIVMRPYQIFAVKRVIKQALETAGNGYVWHATGSGKTLTSFKIAQLLAENEKFTKVVFLVDRRDLDGQTIEEFNKFEADIVLEVDNSRALAAQLKSSKNKLIVSTIQKLANLIKREDKALAPLKNENILFIIDECHRSQFGEMHKLVSTYFTKAQYFGFTGTPLFKENKSQDGRSTADIFGACLHSYLIKNAISDKNVLPLSIEYVDTFHAGTDFDDYSVEGVDMQEVLLSDQRITLVANDVLKQLPRKTQKGKYNAIFAVDSTRMLAKYFDKLTVLNPELKIATIFSYGANEDSEGRTESSRDTLEKAMAHYNMLYSTNFDMTSYNEYFTDITKRMKRKEIDVLLVVNMFLTGFDSPITNTLFFDKKASYHTLWQAFSRPNRVASKLKSTGHIRCYQPLKTETDEAIRLFSQSDNTDGLLARSYEVCLLALQEAIEELLSMVPTPQDVDLLEGETEKAGFVRLYRNIARVLVEIQPHAEFDYETANLGTDEQTLINFRSKYLDIKDEADHKEKISILSELDFEIELIAHDDINVDYIKRLIESIDMGSTVQRTKDVDFILKQLDSGDSPELRMKSEYLRKFLNIVLPTLGAENDLGHELDKYSKQEFKQEVEDFAKVSDISYELLKSWIDKFEYEGRIDRKPISSSIALPFVERRALTKSIVAFITTITTKY
jgi:type I restriction enzyme R subunit